MHHLAKITFSKLDQLPYHGECACGTAGDFASNEAARNYLANHLTRIQGINSAEFLDETTQQLPVPIPESPAQEKPPSQEGKTEQEQEKEDAAKEDESAA